MPTGGLCRPKATGRRIADGSGNWTRHSQRPPGRSRGGHRGGCAMTGTRRPFAHGGSSDGPAYSSPELLSGPMSKGRGSRRSNRNRFHSSCRRVSWLFGQAGTTTILCRVLNAETRRKSFRCITLSKATRHNGAYAALGISGTRASVQRGGRRGTYFSLRNSPGMLRR